MQGNVLVYLAVVVALLGLASAAAVDGPTVLEQLPAMLVRSGPAQLADPSARQCTNSACATLCHSLGWASGFCLDAQWCLCHN